MFVGLSPGNCQGSVTATSLRFQCDATLCVRGLGPGAGRGEDIGSDPVRGLKFVYVAF